MSNFQQVYNAAVMSNNCMSKVFSNIRDLWAPPLNVIETICVIGPGNGDEIQQLLDVFTGLSVTIQAYEIDPTMLTASQTRFSEVPNVTVSSITGLDTSSLIGSFDLVCCNFVLCNGTQSFPVPFVTASLCFNELSSWLKSHGFLTVYGSNLNITDIVSTLNCVKTSQYTGHVPRWNSTGTLLSNSVGEYLYRKSVPPAILAYQFNNNANLGEDSSPDNHSMTNFGITYASPGVGGSGGAGVAIAGTGLQATSGSFYNYDFRTTPMSFALWFKGNDPGSGGEDGFLLGKWKSNTGYRFQKLGTNFRLYLGGGNTGGAMVVESSGINITTSVFDNTFHHIGVTYDGSGNASGVNMYVDGQPVPGLTIVTDTLVASSSTTERLCLMRRSNNSTTTQGTYDDFRLFTYNMDATQMELLYNSPDQLF